MLKLSIQLVIHYLKYGSVPLKTSRTHQIVAMRSSATDAERLIHILIQQCRFFTTHYHNEFITNSSYSL